MLIPVKPFSEAKSRLAPAMSAAARARLAERLFRHVFAAAADFVRPGSVIVLSRSSDILEFARVQRATGLPEHGKPELNAALAQAAAHACAEGVSKILVIASDLPLLRAADLALFAELPCAIAPDRHGRGTNALLWPTAPRPGFHFGDGSFARHLAEARTCGLDPHIVRSPGLAHDVDLPDDLVGDFSGRFPQSGRAGAAEPVPHTDEESAPDRFRARGRRGD
ncbi:MAG TPA: 2-phospho-L-lactate guanylyltransferase [Rhizomicrobium sp.]